MIYNKDLYRKNVSKTLLESKRDNLVCPECGKKFNLFYSRLVSCEGCPYSAEGCEFVRCPRCDNEFLLEKYRSKKQARHLDNYMNRIINRYLDDFGKSPRR